MDQGVRAGSNPLLELHFTFTEPASPHACLTRIGILTVGLHERGKQGHGL